MKSGLENGSNEQIIVPGGHGNVEEKMFDFDNPTAPYDLNWMFMEVHQDD